MIDESRFRECSDLLALKLNPVEDGETVDLDGTNVNISQFLPIVFRHLNKVVIKHGTESEEIFSFIVDSIHYFTGVTDERPDVTYTSKNNLDMVTSGIKDSEIKLRVKTK